ncbi:membrane protein [Chitiniphilus shinanonensis]|uniref:Membrane protein n=1 Tax=Chitiniphilus shinanonensis TaxID=553088 RepID=A0ABQ6BX08_9NEIS|nr:PepSY-associated TM helix domain-containing protein [Chitiniphilus shinanonensis]GLS05942.1 membrane protein [Chitiniphilus shinanonensis]
MNKNPDRQNRAFWLKHLHRWHWISSALCLIGMLLFAVTGITLNHAGQIEAHPTVTQRDARLPQQLLPLLARAPQSDKAPLPRTVADWIDGRLALDLAGREAEWSDDEVYVSLPRPGGDAWLSLDRASGDIAYELTERGWVSYLNDLHKGRNTGAAWSWFLDIFAGAALLFCITGLFLLHLHAGNRPATWPLVGLGLVAPLLLALLFIH